MELLPPADPLWTIRQACAWLSLTEHALRTMLRRNQLPAEAVVRLGRRIRFKSAKLRDWVERRSA
jgi:excisionase family DNA binding protein